MYVDLLVVHEQPQLLPLFLLFFVAVSSSLVSLFDGFFGVLFVRLDRFDGSRVTSFSIDGGQFVIVFILFHCVMFDLRISMSLCMWFRLE